MKVLFLYTELAAYVVNCCEELAQRAEVNIVRWPVNKEAPFQFQFSDRLRVYDKRDYPGERLNELIQQITPDIIVCSGWIDKDYLRIVSIWSGRVPTVLALDTRWMGSLKQQLARVLSRLSILPKFSHAWVPGESQRRYALKLGFKAQRIHLGFYCCDLDRFNQYHRDTISAKKDRFPHRFIYVGRYYDFKGLPELWEAFTSLSASDRSDWELWCLGTGTLTPIRHPSVKHLGFVQPETLGPFIRDTGVFVLPSRFEPWGVVVQEMAAAGFPLLLSDAVGASDAFLRTGQNGESFKANNVAELKTRLKKIMALSDNALFLMAEQSHTLAQQITPARWAQTLTGIYEEWHAK